LVLRRRACENFFRPRADSTYLYFKGLKFCHARWLENLGNGISQVFLGEKNFSHSSPYASLRRKTKKAPQKADKTQLFDFVVAVGVFLSCVFVVLS
jgi:hypothetical protein